LTENGYHAIGYRLKFILQIFNLPIGPTYGKEGYSKNDIIKPSKGFVPLEGFFIC